MRNIKKILILTPWLFFPLSASATDYLAEFSQKIFTDATQTYVSALLLLILAAAVAALFRMWGWMFAALGGAFISGILLFKSVDIISWFPV